MNADTTERGVDACACEEWRLGRQSEMINDLAHDDTVEPQGARRGRRPSCCLLRHGLPETAGGSAGQAVHYPHAGNARPVDPTAIAGSYARLIVRSSACPRCQGSAGIGIGAGAWTAYPTVSSIKDYRSRFVVGGGLLCGTAAPASSRHSPRAHGANKLPRLHLCREPWLLCGRTEGLRQLEDVRRTRITTLPCSAHMSAMTRGCACP